MSSENYDLILAQIRETVNRLQTPISELSELLSLLSALLDGLGLLPPVFRQYNTHTLPRAAKEVLQIAKYVPPIQTSILERIVPTWETTLREQGYDHILYQYFCPDSFSSSSRVAADVALCAYATLLSSPIDQFSVKVLRQLTRHYPIDRLHSFIYSIDTSVPPHRKMRTWEDLVQSVVALPSKVANKSDVLEVPTELVPNEYFKALCTRLEILISSLTRFSDTDVISSLTFLVTKMINVGLFPSTTSLSPSQTSFPSVALPVIRSRVASLSGNSRENYANVWREVFYVLPTSLFSKVLVSVFTYLAEPSDDTDASEEARALIKREAALVSKILGILEGEEDEKWLSVSSLLTRTWSIGKARILVCWASLSDGKAVPPCAVETLIGKILDAWASEEHIKHSLLSHQQYLTTTLILAVYALPTTHPRLESLAFSSALIGAISGYIKHLDPAVRRCGMLAAELVAHRTNKKLDFEQWEGEGEGREWARAVRRLVGMRDADVEQAAADVVSVEPVDLHTATEQTEDLGIPTGPSRVQLADKEYDSDDSLEGYASSPASSCSPSPTPEELEEIEKEPTIHVGRKKIQRPVYLFDLGHLISGSKKPDDPQNTDRIQIALDCAEELIRKKKGFGFELEENAVNLVYILVGLQNNYDLEGFDQKRQAAVSALVACCPKKVAPTIIDEFFKNQYSTDQRFVILNALALGSRELASLSIPPPAASAERTSFPSKQLPPSLHKRYIAYEEGNGSQVQHMLDDISRTAIESGKNAAEAKVAPIVRERQLRIKQPSRVTEVRPGATFVPKEGPFSELAAEYFIGPLIGKFWLFLRDEQEREKRTAHRKTAYRGTGTGLILSPLVLSHFLGTLAVLMHAARHSPAFLAVLAPDALELAVTLGTRPMSGAEEDKEREAAVVTAALELSVVTLDGCLELDAGKSICLEYSALLLGTGEWAGEVLNALERGARVAGGGGMHEIKLRRAAAGVALKVDELTSRWRQSMISTY